MGVNTKSFDNASDMITFSRASGAYGLTKVSYGNELVTNGDFATDSGWTKGAGWSISGGVAVSDGGSTYTELSQSITGFDTDKVYKFCFNLVVNSGVARFFADGTAYENLTSSGTYEYIIKPTSSAFSPRIQSRSPAFDGTVDNFSVKEVTYNSSAAGATLQLTYHPNDVPRIEYALDGTAKGLLVEEARTNLITYSEDFTNSFWGTTYTTRTANTAIAPDGNTTADTITTTNSAFGCLVRNTSISYSASTTYTMSVYAKAGTASKVGIRVSGSCVASGDVYPTFDLNTGSFTTITPVGGTVVSGSAVNVGNGWWRLSVTYTTPSSAPASTTDFAITDDSNSVAYTPAGTETIYLWGAQFEAGSFPTSYIKTEGATATRSADVASIPVADFGYNQSEGTLFAEYKRFGSGNAWIAYLGESSNTYISLGNGNSGTAVRVQVNENGTPQATLDTAIVSTGTVYKQVGAFKANDFSATENGNAVHTDTSGTLPDGITFLDIGEQYGFYLNGHIKSIKYYPRRLTNAQLQELTT